MMVANDILKQVKQPNGFAGMALLYQKEQLIPGSTQYTIHRYYSQAPAELEDTGMFIYHYNAKRPSDNFLELINYVVIAVNYQPKIALDHSER
jgi:hypothetical protein